MTDYASEFQRLFSDGGGCPIENWDWTKPMPFDGSDSGSCYSDEAALVSSLTAEAINTYGFEVDYYIKQISTKRDRLLGEDPLENIVRRFRLSVYSDSIPSMQKTYQIQGMLYDEVFEVQAAIAHFQEASQYDYDRTQAKYPAYEPKIGDIMCFQYSGRYFEIISVKSFKEGTAFLGTAITYTFTLRAWKNGHEDVNLTGEVDDKMPIEEFTSLAETFDIENKTSEVSSSGDILSVNDWVDTSAASLFKYEPVDEPAEISRQKRPQDPFDPFDGW